MQMNETTNATMNETSINQPIDMKLFGTIFFSLICSVGAFGNLLVILTLARWQDMRTPCNLLVLNISCVDLIIAVIMSPLRIIEISGLGWIFGEFLCYVFAPLQDCLVSVSAVSHTVIAIERYRAIILPFKPRLTTRKVKIAIILIWIGCYLGVSLPLVFFVTYERTGNIMNCMANLFHVEDIYIYTIYLVAIFVVLPLLLQTTSYIMIVRYLNRKDAVQVHQESCSSSQSQIQMHTTRRRIMRKKRLIKMLISLMVVFQLCYIPRGIMAILWRESMNKSPLFHFIDLTTLLLFYIKHIINPLILYCMSHDFRHGLVSLFICRSVEEYNSADSGSGQLKKSTQRTRV